jgi:alpha-L-fucosidase
MTVQYSKASPYFKTTSFGNKYLDVMVHRAIDKQVDDVSYTIDRIYQNRPDLLAFDLYGDSALWWVFRSRNPNVLDDPIFDFKAGVTIMIPKKTTLVSNLGL